MSEIFGNLGLSDTDRVFQATVGQEVIYETATQYLDRVNADLQQAVAVFVSGMTKTHKERFKLPGGGFMQRRGEGGRGGAVKAYGSWDVAYPLEDFEDQLADERVARAYMTVIELERHIQSVVIRNTNTVRYEILKALLNNTQRTFIDPLWGSLSIEPLANGDTVVYPPVLGATSEATEDHYLESGYLASAISDANDPYVTLADELEEHFGTATGGSDLVVFINNAQTALTRDLTAFVPVSAMGITPRNDTVTVNSIPPALLAGSWRVLGKHDESGCWIVEWRHVPANYMVGVHLEVEAPLKMRVDPADTGLPQGLALVAEDDSEPFKSSFWSNRFGVGVSNRLNGAIMELGNGGTYTIPSGFS